MKCIIILLIILIILLLIAYILIKLSFIRDDKLDTTPAWKEYIDANQKGREFIYSLKHKDLYIQSFDNLKLHALFVPNAKQDKTIICVHGYKAKDGLYDFGQSAKFLYSTGYNLLFVDDRSHGLSHGKYIGFGVLDSKDVNSWVNYLTSEYKQEKIVLYGMSMGAASVLNASAIVNDSVKGIVADCGFASGLDEVKYQIKQMYHLPSFPLVPLANLELKLLAKYSLKEKEAYKSIREYKGKLLIIHGSNDNFVCTKDAYKIYENANCDKNILIVEGASHAKSYLKDSNKYEEAFMRLLNEID